MSKMDEILKGYRQTYFMTASVGDDNAVDVMTRQHLESIQQIKALIKSKGWYYYDPDELGEDAFKPLGDDEVNEL